MDLHIKPTLNGVNRTYGVLQQLWKSIRPVVSMNPSCMNTFRLYTKEPGIYTVDVGLHFVGKTLMQFRCSTDGQVSQNLFFEVIDNLDQIEISIRNILQYYSYFIRPEYKQKPDIHQATERFRHMADEHTLAELKEVLGKAARVRTTTEDDRAIDMDFSDIDKMDLESTMDIDEELSLDDGKDN